MAYSNVLKAVSKSFMIVRHDVISSESQLVGEIIALACINHNQIVKMLDSRAVKPSLG